MESSQTFALSTAIGAVAGLRALTAPAVVSWAVPNKTRTAAKVLTVLAAAELVADKLPMTPNRTIPGSLILRIISGGICGAVICSSRKQSSAAGAILGGAAAVGATFAGYGLRKRAGKNIAAALAEDAVAVGSAIAIVSALHCPGTNVIHTGE